MLLVVFIYAQKDMAEFLCPVLLNIIRIYLYVPIAY